MAIYTFEKKNANECCSKWDGRMPESTAPFVGRTAEKFEHEYVPALKNNSAWGGILEFWVASWVWEVSFVIVTHDGDYCMANPEYKDNFVGYVEYVGAHYNPLVGEPVDKSLLGMIPIAPFEGMRGGGALAKKKKECGGGKVGDS